MKKMLVVVMLCLLVSMSQAVRLSYEDFSGYANDGVTQLDADIPSPAVTGYIGDWVHASTSWGTGDIVSQPGGYVSGLDGFAEGTSGRVARQLDASISVTSSTVGTLYLGWRFQVNNASAQVYEMLALYDGIGNTNNDGFRNFDAGATTNGGLGAVYGFGADNDYASTGVSLDTGWHLMVARFDLSSTAASDSVTVWVDPTSEASPSVTKSGKDLIWNTLTLSDYANYTGAWDDIKWGTTFNDVLPELLYSSPKNGAVLIPVTRTASENDLIFTVANANIADVEVYLSANDPNTPDLIKTIYSAGAGQQIVTLETELAMDLSFETDYYWKVIGYEPNAVSGLIDIPVPGPVWSFTTAPETPLITLDPHPYTAVDAGEPEIVLSANGINGDLQWYKDGSPIADGADYAGTTTNALTIYDVQLADEGYYTLRVSNLIGSDESDPARVMIHRQTSYYDFESTSVVDGNDVYVDSIDGYPAVLMQEAASAGWPTSVNDANSISGLGAYLYLNNADHATDPNGQYLQIYPGVVDYEDITISLWVYPLGGNEWQRILDFGNGTPDYLFLTPDAGGDGGLRYATRINNGGEQQVNSGYLQSGSWYHTAISIGGKTGRLFVNGEWVDTNPGLTLNPIDVGAVLNYIGKSQFNDQEFNGYIDDLKIYNYARTNEQIAQDYMAVTGDSYVCDAENNDVWNYDDVEYGGNGNCKIDLPDFAGMAARWLEADQFYPAP